jgi:hypothetical protein
LEVARKIIAPAVRGMDAMENKCKSVSVNDKLNGFGQTIQGRK